MTKKITFEDYLKDVHAKDYTGTDDDMPDDFESWVGELDVQEVMDFAEIYGLIQNKAGYQEAVDKYNEIVKQSLEK